MATNRTRRRGLARRTVRIAGTGAIVTAVAFGTQGLAQAADATPVTSAATLAAPSPARPIMWLDFSGSHRIRQSNNTVVDLRVDQDELNQLTGTASYRGGSGPLTGSISRGKITFTITWSERSVGVYTADILPNGTLRNGRTFDRMNPSSTASWRLTR